MKRLLTILFCLLCVASVLFSQEEDMRLRLALPPMQIVGGTQTANVLAESARVSMTLNLNLLGEYNLIEAVNPVADVEAARALAESQQIDKIILGRIAARQPSGFIITYSLYDRRQGDVILTEERTANNVFSVFGVIDEISSAFLDGLTGRHIGTGSLFVTRTGAAGDYRIFVETFDAGMNVTEIRQLVTGAYRFSVVQNRLFRPEVIYQSDIVIEEGVTTEVSFDDPVILPSETAEFDNLLTQFDAARDNATLENRIEGYLAAAPACDEVSAARERFFTIRLARINELITAYEGTGGGDDVTQPILTAIARAGDREETRLASGRLTAARISWEGTVLLSRAWNSLAVRDEALLPDTVDYGRRLAGAGASGSVAERGRNTVYQIAGIEYTRIVSSLTERIWEDAVSDFTTMTELGDWLPPEFLARADRAKTFVSTLAERDRTTLFEDPELLQTLVAEFGETTVIRPINELTLLEGEIGLLVTTDPPGLIITINGTNYGSGPVFIRFTEPTNATIVAEAPDGRQSTPSVLACRSGMNVIVITIPDAAPADETTVAVRETVNRQEGWSSETSRIVERARNISRRRLNPVYLPVSAGFGYGFDGVVYLVAELNLAIHFGSSPFYLGGGAFVFIAPDFTASTALDMIRRLITVPQILLIYRVPTALVSHQFSVIFMPAVLQFPDTFAGFTYGISWRGLTFRVISFATLTDLDTWTETITLGLTLGWTF